MKKKQMTRAALLGIALLVTMLVSGCSFLGPDAASDPSPANGATSVSVGIDLGWDGTNGATYNVYLGTTNPPPQIAYGVTKSVYGLSSLLSPSTTYYWRVDTVVGIVPYKGSVWSFTTAP